MKKIHELSLCIILTLVLSAFCAVAEEIDYYYRNACESCRPEEAFVRDFEQLTGRSPDNLNIRYHNIFEERELAAYRKAVNEDEMRLPLLIIDGVYYAGTDSISSALTAQFGVSENSTDSIVYFLTSVSCESCANARKTVESSPAIVPVRLDSRIVSSNVIINEINVSLSPDTAYALFNRYNVPDKDRKTPIILMGSTYISGQSAIEDEFIARLRAGEAVGSPLLEQIPINREDDEKVSLGGALISGLVAGFNPCALSMLLAMLAVIINLKRNVLLYGSLYLSGKLAAYMLISFVFSGLWVRFAPQWLPTAAKTAITAVSAYLIVLNLLDARNAAGEQYGRIRNQLPAGMRKGIRALIERMLISAGPFMVPAALLVGFIVACAEFMCAGQLYIAFLISGSGAGKTAPLIVYCFAFLAPSVCLTFAVASVRKTVFASDWVLRKMPLIKAAAALVLALMIGFLWLS